MKTRKWKMQDLEFAVKSSDSYRKVLNYLGLKPAGGNYIQIKKYIKEAGLNTEHFTGRAWNKGKSYKGKPTIPLALALTVNSNYQSYKLKIRLINAGIKVPRCEICGWAEKAPDGRIPVELDHINGDHSDNRLENLRILCPNCHSLRENHRGKNKRKTV